MIKLSTTKYDITLDYIEYDPAGELLEIYTHMDDIFSMDSKELSAACNEVIQGVMSTNTTDVYNVILSNQNVSPSEKSTMIFKWFDAVIEGRGKYRVNIRVIKPRPGNTEDLGERYKLVGKLQRSTERTYDERARK
jgi:hypothetical protein